MDKNIKNIKEDIKIFSYHLKSSAPKWSNLEWVKGQYQSHIDEVKELEDANDIHLQAEMVDKAIIAHCLYNIDPSSKSYETNMINDIDLIKIHTMKNGVVEYGTYANLIQTRFDKFDSKLHLIPEGMEELYNKKIIRNRFINFSSIFC